MPEESLPVGRRAPPPGVPVRPEAQAPQERAMNAVPPGPVPVETGEEVSGQVRSTQETREAAVQGDSRGARSHLVRKEGPPKRGKPPEDEKPPDPHGRGGSLDLQI